MHNQNNDTIQTYNDEIDDFIGREKELKKLSNTLARTNTQAHLVFINGKGGVGKTVLVRKFKQENQQIPDGTTNVSANIIPIDYDFDDNAFHSAENLRLGIALRLTKLSTLSFSDYLILHNEVENARKSGSRRSSVYIQNLHLKATEKWLETIEKSGNKFIFYFDTVDKLSNVQIDRIGRYFFSSVPKNSVIVISGRDKQINQLKQVIKNGNNELHDQATVLNLLPLTEEEYHDFIETKIKKYGYSSISDLPIDNPEELIKFIRKTSDGLPILIGLSLEPFSSPTTEKINAYIQDINQLKSEILNKDQLHAKFKSLLIHHYLDNYSSNLRLLVLVLAHAWPLGRRAIEVVLDFNDEDSFALMEEARRAIFIKRISNKLYNTKGNIAKSNYFLSLHDVMREMINDYIWQTYDENSELRREVSQKYIEILDKVINEGEKKNKEISSGKDTQELIVSGDQLLLYNLQALLQRLRIQKVRHTTCLDIKDGIELFVKTLKKGSTKYQETQSQYIDELSLHIEEIVQIFHGKKDIFHLLSSDSTKSNKQFQAILVSYFVEKLNFLTSRGRLEEAEKLVKQIRKIEDKLSFELRIEFFREIGTTYLKNGELQTGLDFLKELEKNCKTEANKKAFIQLFPVYVQMGWAYRLLGNIPRADKCYADADALLIEEDLLPGVDLEIIEVAFLSQTWAYTKALLGKSREAKQFLTIARSKFKEIGFELGEGFVESVSGRIQIEFDDYEDAIRCFEKAKDIFPDDNYEWQSKILLGLSEAHILRLEYERSILTENEIQNNINLACTYLEDVEHWNYPSERPELLFTFGNLHFLKKDYKNAEMYYQKTWEESEDQGSLYYLYRSLIAKIRVTLHNKLMNNCQQCKTANEYIKIHKALIKDHSGIKEDKLASAIFWKTIGDLLFLEGDHNSALEYYKSNLPIIAEKGRFYAISLKGQLDRMQAIFLAYATNSTGKADEEKVANVHALAQKLWDYWKEKKYTRRYPSANPVIRSWISGRIDEWSQAPIGNKYKLDEE